MTTPSTNPSERRSSQVEISFDEWKGDDLVTIREPFNEAARSSKARVTMLPTHAIGIDLGTTFSTIAYLNEHGEPITIPNKDGELSTPSVVLFDGNDIIVGAEALRNSIRHPDKVVDHAKRYMGNPAHRWKIGGKSYSPMDISAFIVKSLLDSAREQIGEIERAVITVPAQFNNVQRQATADAGRRAGLKHVDIVNEPVAATLSFVLGTEGIWFTDLATQQTIMVVDLSEGTFDLSLVRYQKNEVRVIASGGDLHLGSVDWNNALEVAISKQFQMEFGIDPTMDRESARALALEAEQASRILSVRAKATITCAAGGQRKTYQVDLEQFEQLTKDLVKRMETVTLNLLRESDLTWNQVDVVLTTGNASRMPMMQSLFKQLRGRTLNTSLSPDQSIAHGATYYAGMLLTNSAFARSIINPSATSRMKQFDAQEIRSPVAQPAAMKAGHTVVKKKYLRLNEAAAQLGITEDDLIRLRYRGDIRGFADKGSWYFKADDIEQFRRQSLGTSAADAPVMDFGNDTTTTVAEVDRDRRATVIRNGFDATSEIKPSVRQPMSAASPGASESPKGVSRIPSSWDRVIQSFTSSDVWALVPIGKLAELEGIPRRFELLEPECRQLLEVADNLGFALEPDARITGRRYQWFERVSAFPRDEGLSGDLSSYRGASALLRLGILVALADGTVGEVELTSLFAHLKSQFPLTPHETVRLDHLRYLLTKHRQPETAVVKELCRTLTVPQRSQIGVYLVAIAASDGNVTVEERRVLGQIYAELGISDFLSSHLAGSASSASVPVESSTNHDERTVLTLIAKAEGVSLDNDRIRRIEEEREKLSESLQAVPQVDTFVQPSELIARLVATVLSPGARLIGALVGPGGRVASQIKTLAGEWVQPETVPRPELPVGYVRLPPINEEQVWIGEPLESEDVPRVDAGYSLSPPWVTDVAGASLGYVRRPPIKEEQVWIVEPLESEDVPHVEAGYSPPPPCATDVTGVSLGYVRLPPIKEEQVWIGEPLESEDVPRVDAGYSLSPPWASVRPGISFDDKRIRRIEEERAKISEALQEVQRVGYDDQPSTRAQREAVTPPKLPPLLDVPVPNKPAPRIPTPAKPTRGLKLDMNRVDQISANTAQLAELLCEVFRDKDEHLDSVPVETHRPQEADARTTAIPATALEQATTDATDVGSEPDASATFGGLAPRFVPFVERISRQPTWTKAELDRLAREFNLMLDGTIDAVNEWADEQFGDLLMIDEGDVFLIQGELLIDIAGPT